MTRHSAIVSTGVYVPEIEISNDLLRERFANSAPGFVDKMEEITGIRTRWSAPPDWATSDLVVEAAKQALERAEVAPSDLDLILVGTDSPDYITPATSVVVQGKLGANNAGTFDVGCACASFPTALSAAAGIIAANPSIDNVLVSGAYMMRKLADPNDPVSFFYGDGAGAVVVQPSDEPGIQNASFRADGSYAGHWGVYSGGTAEPATVESVRAGRTLVRMLERYPPEVNDVGWPIIVRQLAEDGGFELSDIDLAIFTQVRSTTILLVMDELGLPHERTHMIMGKWGYTGSACIPMALHDAVEKGRVAPGQLLVLVGSGVGYNQAGVVLRVTDALFRPNA